MFFARNLNFEGLYEDLKLERVLDYNNTSLSVRGVYAERCVANARTGIMTAYPFIDGNIVFEESVFAELNLSQSTKNGIGISDAIDLSIYPHVIQEEYDAESFNPLNDYFASLALKKGG